MVTLAPTGLEPLTTAGRARLLLHEVNAAGGCSHPIRLHGSTVNQVTGELRTGSLSVACKDRRAVLCPSCSALYQADAWVLVATGLNGGKGVPADVASHPRLFLTLTAPSFGSVHRIQSTSGTCHPTSPATQCEHGNSTKCTATHNENDQVLGSPICSQCFDYQGAVLWNAHASRLWNRTINQVRRRLANTHGLTDRQLREVAHLNYLKVAELQRRGLLHFHLILRVDGGDGPDSAPPSWLTDELVASVIEETVRSFQVRTKSGTIYRWGTQLKVEPIRPAGEGPGEVDRRAASYLAKYATKTTAGSAALARRFRTRQEIRQADVADHLKTFVLTAWDLGSTRQYAELNLKSFAHCLGYRGHLLTKSLGYSTTFGQLRSARADHQRSRTENDPIKGSFKYQDRGYVDPDAEQLAEVIFEARRGLRQARSRSRSVPSAIPNSVPNRPEQGERNQGIPELGTPT